MNHFKAPHVPPKKKPSDMYGEIALKSLISGMLELGSRKRDLRAMLLGGGSVIEQVEGQPNIGKENIRFARETLKNEGIPVKSSHTGRNFGRKVVFNTSEGTATIARVNTLGTFIGRKN
jgi:chemotaxis protein CheD